MPNPQQHGKGFTGPFKAPGLSGGSQDTSPQPQSLLDFERRMAEKASYGGDSVMELAADLGRDLAKSYRARRGEGGTTQMRKVYGEIRALQEKARSGLDAVRPELRLIQAHVAYAVARDTLPILFKKFADLAIARLLLPGTTKDEIDRFVKFFEAVYAHFYYTSKKEG
jgi:CRISPR type III-A-associated protein Csm2